MTEATNGMWMVRAGEQAYAFEDFKKGYIAIGWNDIGDLSDANTQEDIRLRYLNAFPGEHSAKVANAVAMIFKFRHVLQKGAKVLTYDPETRTYLVGVVTGEYQFEPNLVRDHAHCRAVNWTGTVERDKLKVTSRNSLGSTLTLFRVNDEVTADIESVLSGNAPAATTSVQEEKEELDLLKEDTVSRAHELIRDRILSLSPDQMEQLVAALLRAMGYKTKITPKGPDRGVDVIASPDGLGLETPRIKAEVKHRPNTAIGSQEVRGFLGGLRSGDRGLYVSTGGFTKDAKYEAERATIPLTLLNSDELTSLVISHYEAFDMEARVLIPLVRIYWPTD